MFLHFLVVLKKNFLGLIFLYHRIKKTSLFDQKIDKKSRKNRQPNINRNLTLFRPLFGRKNTSYYKTRVWAEDLPRGGQKGGGGGGLDWNYQKTRKFGFDPFLGPFYKRFTMKKVFLYKNAMYWGKIRKWPKSVRPSTGKWPFSCTWAPFLTLFRRNYMCFCIKRSKLAFFTFLRGEGGPPPPSKNRLLGPFWPFFRLPKNSSNFDPLFDPFLTFFFHIFCNQKFFTFFSFFCHFFLVFCYLFFKNFFSIKYTGFSCICIKFLKTCLNYISH